MRAIGCRVDRQALEDLLELSPERRKALAELLLDDEPDVWVRDAEDSLRYWEARERELPAWQWRRRREARQMADQWRARIGLTAPAQPPVRSVTLPHLHRAEPASSPRPRSQAEAVLAGEQSKPAPNGPAPDVADGDHLLDALWRMSAREVEVLRDAAVLAGVSVRAGASVSERRQVRDRVMCLRRTALELAGITDPNDLIEYGSYTTVPRYPGRVTKTSPLRSNDMRMRATTSGAWRYADEAYFRTIRASELASGPSRRSDEELACAMHVCAAALLTDPSRWTSARDYADAIAPYSALMAHREAGTQAAQAS